MTTLIDTTFPRTLDEWVQQFTQPAWRGSRIEGWLFEGVAARRAAERRLAEAGVSAQLRSAYKPLVFHVLEEVEASTLAAVKLTYPVHAQALPQRFLQEAYPLAALLAHCRLDLVAGGADLHYHLVCTHQDGGRSETTVFAPNRLHTDPQGLTHLSPTGWLRATKPGSDTPAIDAACATDVQQLFEEALRCVDAHAWPAREPYFERLDIRVDMPGIEHRTAVGHETISSFEALHEDLYFSLLEMFQRRSGRAAQDRRLQPGQIVPDIRASRYAARLRISHNRFDAPAQDLCGRAQPEADVALELVGDPLSPERIAACMGQLGGEAFTARSLQGRAVAGLYRQGASAPVLISGGQHANETSGVVGALRAAQVLHTRADAHFALIPLENPDGYALHRELRLQHASHMHHAARYSALGDDIEYRDQPPFHEREARHQGLALSGAQLHVNLHGYPAHEWTRPFSGYVPRGFELWTIPKGFFLILRHHAGWQAEAEALLEHVSAALARVPGLLAFNQRQMALYERHAGPIPFAIRHGMACTVSEVDRPGAPVTLITEYPDETVDGDAFRLAHTVQMQTVLAAVDAWQPLARRHR
ncbi:peptidase M14 [Rhodoferax koreense]|uniref:Peptidase M14 n=1 Tax=Rhodoferax koreensis TaxID=1842727 RepID=A0A1P8JSR7_9BURK|nr:peptidase M14 [Rhodoferax koreense]APW36778.1 peptidase M14 [Rhodoferax koreense]